MSVNISKEQNQSSLSYKTFDFAIIAYTFAHCYSEMVSVHILKIFGKALLLLDYIFL